jgi:hypothetical protein
VDAILGRCETWGVGCTMGRHQGLCYTDRVNSICVDYYNDFSGDEGDWIVTDVWFDTAYDPCPYSGSTGEE